MNKIIHWLFILTLTAPLLTATHLIAADLEEASPESVGMSSKRLARIKPYMQRYVDEGELAGVQTLIARNGKIVHFDQVGKLNLDTGQKIKHDALFRIYSMTKPIATTAAMILYEEGLFQLNDPVEKYLPEFKDQKVLIDGLLVDPTHPFTIRELMSHTAGLTYGVFGNTAVDRLYREALWDESINFKKSLKNLDDLVAAMGPIPLEYQPSTKWVYSLSVDVLGALIERVSGQPLDVFLYERIFEPLNMQDTFFEVPKNKLHRFGTLHMRSPENKLIIVDRPETSPYTNPVTLFSAGGGLVSSSMDYLRYSQMMLNGGELNGVRIISPTTVDLMTRNQLGADIKSGLGELPGTQGTLGFGLGFGVSIAPPKIGSGSMGEYNWGGAAGTVFWIDPKEDIVAIIMVQMMQNPIDLRAKFKALTYQAITKMN
jgi:CubicO group peptidase (beta-lactamase class C family)